MLLKYRFLPVDNTRLANLCGTLDDNLDCVAAGLHVKIARHGERVQVEGAKAHAEQALALLQSLYAQARHPLDAETVQMAVFEASRNLGVPHAPSRQAVGATVDAAPKAAGEEAPALHTRRADLAARTPNQAQYLRQILTHDLSFGIGPAGTGKTFLAVACAVDALERNAVQRIVLTRPAVEAGERLGFLPGDLTQKVDPYLRPLYDALYDLMGFDRVTKAFERATLEIAPLAFMRGRTLNHAFVILDEAQNTTPEQMKMFLTRIGFGSKAVVTGDTSQIDLPRGSACGLIDAQQVLGQVKGIAMTHFTARDVVRHPLVARIVQAYDDARVKPAGDAVKPVARSRARRPEL